MGKLLNYRVSVVFLRLLATTATDLAPLDMKCHSIGAADGHGG